MRSPPQAFHDSCCLQVDDPSVTRETLHILASPSHSLALPPPFVLLAECVLFSLPAVLLSQLCVGLVPFHHQRLWLGVTLPFPEASLHHPICQKQPSPPIPCPVSPCHFLYGGAHSCLRAILLPFLPPGVSFPPDNLSGPSPPSGLHLALPWLPFLICTWPLPCSLCFTTAFLA